MPGSCSSIVLLSSAYEFMKFMADVYLHVYQGLYDGGIDQVMAPVGKFIPFIVWAGACRDF